MGIQQPPAGFLKNIEKKKFVSDQKFTLYLSKNIYCKTHWDEEIYLFDQASHKKGENRKKNRYLRVCEAMVVSVLLQ